MKVSRSIRYEVMAIYFIFFYAIAFPTFYNKLGTAGAILINGGLIILCGLYLALFSHFKVPVFSVQEKTIIGTIILSFLFYFFSISLSTLLSKRLIFRDVYELHRPILYGLIFTSSLFFFRYKERLKHLNRLMHLSFFVSIFLGINHFFRIQDSLTVLYTERLNIITERVSTPFPNPYDYSFYMLWPFSYFLIRSLSLKSTRLKLISTFFCLISATGVLCTQSRTGFILLGIVLIGTIPISLIIENKRNIKKIKILVNSCSIKTLQYPLIIALIICLCVAIYVVYGDGFTYLISGINGILREGDLGTGETRLNLMVFTLDQANENWFVVLLGHGPSKAIFENPESGYAYFIYRYGFLNLILFFFVPLFLLYSYLVKIIREKEVNSTTYMAILAWYLTLPIAYLSTNFTEQIRLSFLYYFLIGFVIRSYFVLPRSKKNKVNPSS